MPRMSIAQAKAGSAALVARADAGEEVVIITRNGTPVARVAPLPPPDAVRFDDLHHLEFPGDLALPQEAIDAFDPDDGA